MSKYPNSFCIKCKKHTQTLGKHTILLTNKRRVLKGICPECSSETYRFMPKSDPNSRSKHLSLIRERELAKRTAKARNTLAEFPDMRSRF